MFLRLLLGSQETDTYQNTVGCRLPTFYYHRRRELYVLVDSVLSLKDRTYDRVDTTNKNVLVINLKYLVYIYISALKHLVRSGHL